MRTLALALLLLFIVAVVWAFAITRHSPQEYRQGFMESGQRYYDQRAYEEASIQFRNAIQNDPNFPDAYYELAQSYMHLRRWPEAYNALRRANKIDPNNLEVHLNLAELYLIAHDYSNAEKEASFILARKTNYAPALQVLGALSVGRSDKEKALAAFKKIVNLRPSDPMAYTNLALVEIGSHLFPAAEKDLHAAIEVDPHFVVGYLNLADFYRLQGRTAEAEQVLQKGVEANPESIPASVNLATTLYDNKKDDEAEKVLNGVRSRYRNSPDATLVIGDLYFQRKNLKGAEAEYSQGFAADPQNMDLGERMVEIYLATARLKEAAALNDKLLQAAPHDPTIHLEKGRILMAQGKADAAIMEFRQQTVQFPDSAQAHYFLGWALWENGGHAAGESEIKQAVNLDPNLLPALQTLARNSLADGDFEAAAGYAERSLQIQPSDPIQHAILGTASLRLGDVEKATQQIMAAQALDPQNPDHRLELAAVYAAQGKEGPAEEELKAAIQLAPESTEVLGQAADIRVGMGNRTQAIGGVRQFLSTHPQNGDAHRIYGALLLGQNDLPEARRELERALQLQPDLLLAYLQLGRVCEEDKDPDGAIGNYEKALKLQPNFPPLLTLVGNLYMDKGDLARAESYFNQALAADHDAAIAASNLAWIYATQARNLQQAEALARRAYQLLPSVDSIVDTLGWAEYQSGDFAAATSDLRDCVKNHERYASCHYHLGLALMASRQGAEGKKELNAALALDLEGNDALEARKLVARNQ